MPKDNSKARRAERKADATARDAVSEHKPEGRRLTAGELDPHHYTERGFRRYAGSAV